VNTPYERNKIIAGRHDVTDIFSGAVNVLHTAREFPFTVQRDQSPAFCLAIWMFRAPTRDVTVNHLLLWSQNPKD
jgi:hypothetical protein